MVNINIINKRLPLFCLILTALFISGLQFCSTAFACTAFCINKNGKMLVGNTEDWLATNAKIRSYPAESNKYGRVNIIYINGGFLRFAGINDQGLMFDILLSPAKSTNSPGWLDIALDLTDNILEEFATVAETKTYLQNWNRRPSYFMQYGLAPFYTSGYQVFFADKTGASMVYGGGQFSESSTNYQAVANQFVFDLPFDQGTTSSYYRNTSAFNMVKNIDAYLTDNPGLDLTPEYLLPVLARVDHPTGDTFSTVYSYVMDLTEGLIYLQRPTAPSIYNSSDFMNNTVSAVLDVEEETTKPLSEYGENNYIQYNIEDLQYTYDHVDSGEPGQFTDSIPSLPTGDTIVSPRFNVVPDSNFHVNMTGAGDADLYVVFGDSKDGRVDFISAGYSSNEDINVTVPTYASQAFFIVYGYNQATNLNITVDYSKSSFVPPGDDLVSYEDQEFPSCGKYAFYGPFDTKIGSQFEVTTNDTGDVDIYAYVGTNRNDYKLVGQSVTYNTKEYINIESVPDDRPVSSGTTKMYLKVYAYDSNSECDIMIKYVQP